MGKMKTKKPRSFWEISANIARMYGHRARVAVIKAGEIGNRINIAEDLGFDFGGSGQRLPTTEEIFFGKKPKVKRR